MSPCRIGAWLGAAFGRAYPIFAQPRRRDRAARARPALWKRPLQSLNESIRVVAAQAIAQKRALTIHVSYMLRSQRGHVELHRQTWNCTDRDEPDDHPCLDQAQSHSPGAADRG